MTTGLYQFKHVRLLDGAETYSVILNDGTNTKLRGMRGFGMPRLRVASEQYPYHHGTLRFDQPYLPDREMILVIGIKANSFTNWVAADNALRQSLSPFHVPNELCRLQITRPDRSLRMIDCWLVDYTYDSSDHFSPYWGERKLTYWAPDPSFYDALGSAYDISLRQYSGFTFGTSDSSNDARFKFDAPSTIPRNDWMLTARPQGVYGFHFTRSWPLTFQVADSISQHYVYSGGDLPTFPSIDMWGPWDYAKIENTTTGKHIAIGYDVASGDYVRVNFGAATALHTDVSKGYKETDILRYMSDDSEFWQLLPGYNTIQVTVNGTTTCNMTLTWYDRYSSI